MTRLGERGRYELLAEAGRGGMSVVWRARDRETGEEVAVKLLAEDHPGRSAGARMRREAALGVAERLRHPNVVRVLGAGATDDGAPFVVMEWLDGETLGARIAREGRLPVRAAVGIASRVLDGLEALHAAGVVHRDVKPDNVMLARRPLGVVPVLLDLGIARDAGAGPETTHITRTGELLGTPLYMAPEQLRAAREVDARADLFALAATLYEALAGKPPFHAATYTAVIVALLGATPPRLDAVRPEVPPALADAVAHALEKAPADRPPSAAALREALTAALRGVR